MIKGSHLHVQPGACAVVSLTLTEALEAPELRVVLANVQALDVLISVQAAGHWFVRGMKLTELCERVLLRPLLPGYSLELVADNQSSREALLYWSLHDQAGATQASRFSVAQAHAPEGYELVINGEPRGARADIFPGDEIRMRRLAPALDPAQRIAAELDASDGDSGIWESPTWEEP